MPPPQTSGVIQGSFVGGRPRLPAPGSPGQPPVPPRFPAAGPARGPGQPLPAVVQREMEAVLRTDLSAVRVHVGPEAPALGAFAFTCGRDIYFAPGCYEPHTARGRRLLAHELTHVVQQKAGRARNPFGRGFAVVLDPALEAEAERMGLLAGRTAPAPPPPPAEPRALGPASLQPKAARAPHVQAALGRGAPAPPAAPAGPARPVLQLMEMSGKRERRRSRKYEEADLQLPGEEVPANLTPRQLSLKKKEKEKRKRESSPSKREKVEQEVKKEKPFKKPPAGYFLSFGERAELGWAKTESTGGQTADQYMYDNAQGLDVRYENSRLEYRCARCHGYFPRKKDRADKGEKYITIDHVPPMSLRLESLTREVCDGEYVWQGIPVALARDSYNDIDHLQFMCSSHNSSKGGKVGYVRTPPEIVDTHDEGCKYPHLG